MRNTLKGSSTAPSARSTSSNPQPRSATSSGGSGDRSAGPEPGSAAGSASGSAPGQRTTSPPRSAPANAFSQGFLLEASRREDVHLGGPVVSSGLVGGAYWHGPWDVEPVTMEHGKVWAVVRRGESVTKGDPAAALTRLRSDALLIAAVLPGLAVPREGLTLGDKAKKLGVPIHEGERCIGHVAPRGEPADLERIRDYLHVARTLVGRPESFALAVEALGGEEVPALGRALMRRVVGGGPDRRE